MDETLKKIREMVYQHAERANGASIDDLLNQERFLTLYIQFKMLDTLESIDNGVGDVINRLVAVEDAIGDLNRGRV